MKRIAIIIVSLFAVAKIFAQQNNPGLDSFYLLSPIEVRAVRATDKAPFTKTNLSRKEIVKLNLGQDIPFLLNQTPSVVINSDAGNGVGYTGIHIRGTDASRINVTLNGIPYNDAESQATYFVDLPDFSSSANSIQIQRGVGTSANGAGSFGGSINFSTNEVNKEAYAESNNSYGSFDTWKNTIRTGSGLVAGHFTTDLRLSRISSDGYIDRAATNLKSFHFSTAYIGSKSSVRLNIFSGKEKTYQAWNGVSQADLDAGHRTYNSAGTEKPGTPYDNQTDNYVQNHYQLFYDQLLSKRFIFSTAIFYTKGQGYYEEYKADQSYPDYHLPYPVVGVDTIFTSDFVRRLWLDNDFYGDIFSLQYKSKKTQFTLGGGYNRYIGHHFGDVIWASEVLTGLADYYSLHALKTDLSFYFKQQTEMTNNWNIFYDLQFRRVKYNIDGFKDNPDLQIDNNYTFFNPKAGISYTKNGLKAYVSYSIANKEPNRDDFEAAKNQQPKPEHLEDIEAGIEKYKSNYHWAATLYYMRYKDQLILTGQINDVGAYTRTNIPHSYREGIELEGGIKLNSWFNVSGNIAFSRNKVLDFIEYIDDYDNGGQLINQYEKTNIALSPSIVGGATVTFIPAKNIELSLLSKYISKQYLDNTQQEDRKINGFYTQDARIIYTIKGKKIKEINLTGQVSNLFNKKYEPNGYTYNYFSGGALTVENFYFPMAGINFSVGVNVRL